MSKGSILGQQLEVPDNPLTITSNVSYNNSSTSSIITGKNVQTAIDQLFTSVSNGKNKIASAITGKGVSTSANDSFDTMAHNISAINQGLIKSAGVFKQSSENQYIFSYNSGNDATVSQGEYGQVTSYSSIGKKYQLFMFVMNIGVSEKYYNSPVYRYDGIIFTALNESYQIGGTRYTLQDNAGKLVIKIDNLSEGYPSRNYSGMGMLLVTKLI